MIAVLKTSIRSLMSWGYWRVSNCLKSTCVESIKVAPRAKIGYKAIVRSGAEVYADVTLGDFSYISGPRTYVEAAKIGKFCSIARQVVIGPSDHPLSEVTTHPFAHVPSYGGLATKTGVQIQKSPPVIGNDVWIGMNAIILRGVTIGNGAVIAANSVVTHDVEPYTIVGGAPARVLKRRLSPELAQALERIQWWDWPTSVLKTRLDDFKNPEEFIRKYFDDETK